MSVVRASPGTARGARGAPLGYGVIGNTADSGSVVLGSSPGTPATAPEFPRKPGVFVFPEPLVALLDGHFACQERSYGAFSRGPARLARVATGSARIPR